MVILILVSYLHKKGILLVGCIAGAIKIIGSSSFNSLTTVGYLLEVFIKLWIPSLVRISNSA